MQLPPENTPAEEQKEQKSEEQKNNEVPLPTELPDFPMTGGQDGS